MSHLLGLLALGAPLSVCASELPLLQCIRGEVLGVALPGRMLMIIVVCAGGREGVGRLVTRDGHGDDWDDRKVRNDEKMVGE